MLKTTLAAAALFGAVAGGLILASGAAQAQNMVERASCRSNDQDCYRDYRGEENTGGFNRYCPPGQIPHVWGNGNGIRCETLDGRGW